MARDRRRLEAGGGKVLALEVPGFGGKRNRETIALSLDDVVDELIGDIEAPAFADVTLVGHSQAGTLLPSRWRCRPSLFRRLVYIACCAPVPGQNVLEKMGYGLHRENPEEVRWPLDPELHGKDIQQPLTLCNDMTAEQARCFVPSWTSIAGRLRSPAGRTGLEL